MTRIVALRIQSNIARSQAIEWSRDGTLLGGAWIRSAWGLMSSREEHGDGYWYCPERLFSLDAEEGESRLIAQLDNILSEPDDCSLPAFVVGFGSSTFDLPFLKLRAMRHSVSLACLGPAGTDRYGKGRGRQSPRFHFDLAEEVLGYRRASLETVCDLLGIPTSNSIMPEGWTASNGDDDDARAFSELTLVVLHAIYLQWSFVINELNSKTFELSLRSFCDFLQREGETRPHLLRWLGAYVEGAAETRERDLPRSVEWFG
jgi:hypothetical protein